MNRHPILLVHGFGDTLGIFRVMTGYFEDLGFPVRSLDLIPSNGTVGLDVLAKQLASYIDRAFGSDTPFDLIGFSMGGLVSRYYVQRLGGVDRVRKLITISSPHNGTLTAYVFARPGCLQMRPNSAFLQDLNRDAIEILSQVDFTSIWTPYDLMIVPASSSHLPVGKEIQIPVFLHAWMVGDRRCLDAIAGLLSDE